MGTKKNNNELKLTEEQTEKLIDLYYEETNLWNVGSETYMNKDGRKRSLTRILEVMTDEFPGLVATTDQIKDMLGYLRGYYSKELGKCNNSKTSGSGADDIYVSPWKYFKKFDVFLRSQIIPRGSKSNMDSTSQSSQNEETDIEDDRYSQLSDENEEPRSGAVSRSSTPSVVPLKKRRRQAGAEAMMSEAVSYMADMRTRFKETQKEKEVPAKKSENELFGEYVTVELNKIEDERSRIMIKYKIQSLFYEMQLGLLSQPTSTQPNLYGSMYMANNQLNLLGRMIPTTAPQINIATSNFRENNRQTELHQISSDSEETQNVYTSL